MKHEDDMTPLERFRHRLPQSLDLVITLLNPVLPSGKKTGPLYIIIFVAVWLSGTFLLSSSLSSILLTVMLAISVTLLVSSIAHGWSKREEWRILRESLATRFPMDKTRVAIHGHIYPLTREPFLSPLSGNECVAYVYSISHVYEHRHPDSGDKTVRTETEFEGIGLTPSFIETTHSQVKLLAWPNFTSRIQDFGFKEGPDSMDFEHATKYFRPALFVKTDKQDWHRGGGESMKADTGAVQLDISVGKQSKQDLIGFFAESLVFKSTRSDKWRFTERFIPAGSEVCLIGVYSAERGAIVSDYESTKKQVKLYEGPPSFLELYYGRFIKAIPILAAITLALVGLFLFLRLS
jgi:hypothetical protein